MAITKNAPDYYINETALSFTPNYQGLRDVVYVSIVSNAAIAVYKDGIPELGYAADAGYQRWKLTGYTTKLGTTGAYYAYARLSRSEKKGMIIFSVNEYDIYGSVTSVDEDGTESTTEPSTEYWYIRIGDITASAGGVDRQLNYDSGILGTNRGMAESNTFLDKMFKWNSTTSTFTQLAPLTNLLLAAGAVIEWGGRKIKGLAGIPTDYESSQEMAASEDVLVTPKFVKAYGDHNYVSKKNDDTVEGNITFEKDVAVEGNHSVGGTQSVAKSHSVSGDQTIGGDQTVGKNQTITGTQEVGGLQTLHQGFKTPNFIQQGDIIQGAQVDEDGNAAFASIKSPVMQVYELQYNRKTAVQEEFIFSDGDTIEAVTYIQADGTEIDSTAYNGEEYSYIRLGVRKQYEGYMTTFKDEDILYSNVNIIGESGQPATTGKCWMRVLALGNNLGVDPISSDGLLINAILYSETQCPGNVNMAPTPHMVISRHGNANGAFHPDRQSVFIISTAAENMVQLRGIDSPIIPDTGAYAIVSGKLPPTLLAKVQQYAAFISKDDPINYARYGIFENLIQLDHEGRPIKTERNRGAWSADIANGLVEGEDRYRVTDTTYDTVTHNGSLWKCLVDGTTVEPSPTTTHWLNLVAKGKDGKDGISPQPNLILNSNFDILSDGGASDMIQIAGFQALSSTYGEQWVNIKHAYHARHLLVMGGNTLLAEAKYSPDIPQDDDRAKWCLVGTADSFVIYNKYAGENYVLGVSSSDTALLVAKSVQSLHRWVLSENDLGWSIVYRNKGTALNSYGGYAAGGTVKLYRAADNGSMWNFLRERVALAHWSDQYGFVVPDAYNGSNAYALQPSDDSNYCLTQTTAALQPGIEYTLSFLYRRPLGLADDGGFDLCLDYDFVSNGNITGNADSITYDGYRTNARFTGGTAEWDKASVTFKHTEASARSLTLTFLVNSYARVTQLKLESSAEPTPYRKAESDLTGPAGEAGVALYSLGDWIGDVVYTRTAKSAPILYQDADGSDDIEGTYYMLKTMRSVGQKPSEHPEVWDPITGQRAMYLKFLLANFALFGGNNGAVFYDRYLFSQKGKNAAGEDAYYGNYIDTMFGDDGLLSGVFMPNVVIDFLSGAIWGMNATIRGHVEALSGKFTGELVGATGTFLNGEIRCGENFVINRDGSGSFAKDRFFWTSVGELYATYQVEPLWLNISKMYDRGVFPFLEGTDPESGRIYSGISISLIVFGQYFDMNRYDLADGISPEHVLLLDIPSVSPSSYELYRIAPRNEAFFWGDSDDLYFLQAHTSNCFEFIGYGAAGTTKVLSVGDRVRPRKGVRAKLFFDGERWVGQASEWSFFTL